MKKLLVIAALCFATLSVGMDRKHEKDILPINLDELIKETQDLDKYRSIEKTEKKLNKKQKKTKPNYLENPEEQLLKITSKKINELEITYKEIKEHAQRLIETKKKCIVLYEKIEKRIQNIEKEEKEKEVNELIENTKNLKKNFKLTTKHYLKHSNYINTFIIKLNKLNNGIVNAICNAFDNAIDSQNCFNNDNNSYEKTEETIESLIKKFQNLDCKIKKELFPSNKMPDHHEKTLKDYYNNCNDIIKKHKKEKSNRIPVKQSLKVTYKKTKNHAEEIIEAKEKYIDLYKNIEKRIKNIKKENVNELIENTKTLKNHFEHTTKRARKHSKFINTFIIKLEKQHKFDFQNSSNNDVAKIITKSFEEIEKELSSKILNPKDSSENTDYLSLCDDIIKKLKKEENDRRDKENERIEKKLKNLSSGNKGKF